MRKTRSPSPTKSKILLDQLLQTNEFVPVPKVRSSQSTKTRSLIQTTLNIHASEFHSRRNVNISAPPFVPKTSLDIHAKEFKLENQLHEKPSSLNYYSDIEFNPFAVKESYNDCQPQSLEFYPPIEPDPVDLQFYPKNNQEYAEPPELHPRINSPNNTHPSRTQDAHHSKLQKLGEELSPKPQLYAHPHTGRSQTYSHQLDYCANTLKLTRLAVGITNDQIVQLIPVHIQSEASIIWSEGDCYIEFRTQSAAKQALIYMAQFNFIKVESFTGNGGPSRMERPGGLANPRPITTDMVARRMIAGALGMRAKKKTQQELDADNVKISSAMLGLDPTKETSPAVRKNRKFTDTRWDS